MLFCFSNCCEKAKFSHTGWLFARRLVGHLSFPRETSVFPFFSYFSSRKTGSGEAERGDVLKVSLCGEHGLGSSPPQHLLLSVLGNQRVCESVGAARLPAANSALFRAEGRACCLGKRF